IPALLEFLVIPDSDVDNIGIIYQNNLYVCCTRELVTSRQCEKEDIDRLILRKDIPGIYRYEVNFKKDQKNASIELTNEVQISAIHVFALVSCQGYMGYVTFEGDSVWMNPYGHLPGDMYGYLIFYGWMFIFYLVIGGFWSYLSVMYWKELLYVQNGITGVVVMCLIESIVWYFDYLQFNNIGSHYRVLLFTALLTAATRRMASCMLVIIISMGYGMVRL
ncbi:hypothetical protein RFI_16720, partial [Reticulomyxa filosa]